MSDSELALIKYYVNTEFLGLEACKGKIVSVL